MKTVSVYYKVQNSSTWTKCNQNNQNLIAEPEKIEEIKICIEKTK